QAESMPGAPRLLAIKNEKDVRLSPGADHRIWVGDVLGVMGSEGDVADFATNNFLRMSSRLRALGDVFNPTRAGIAEAVIPPISTYIGKSAAELGLRRQHGLSLLAINRDQKIITKNVRQ